MSALKMASFQKNLGLVKDLTVSPAEELTSMVDIEDPLYNLEGILDFDINWQENLPSV